LFRGKLKARLAVLKQEDFRDYSGAKHLRFAVVDLDRAKEYPLNFVCTLPLRISPNGKRLTAFEKFFEDKSFDMAKKLLTDALRGEEDEEIRAEIQRRLKLLEPEPAGKKKYTPFRRAFRTDPRKSLDRH
jgi:hypothetical protein